MRKIFSLLLLILAVSIPLVIFAEDQFPSPRPVPLVETPYNSPTYQEEMLNQCVIFQPNEADYALVSAITTGDDRLIAMLPEELRTDLLLNYSLNASDEDTYIMQRLPALATYSYFTQIVLMLFEDSSKNIAEGEYKSYLWLQEALGYKMTREGAVEIGTDGKPIRIQTAWMKHLSINPSQVDVELFAESILMGMLYNPDTRVKFQCISILQTIGSNQHIYNSAKRVFDYYGYARDPQTGRFNRITNATPSAMRHALDGSYDFCDVDGTVSTGTISLVSAERNGESFGEAQNRGER